MKFEEFDKQDDLEEIEVPNEENEDDDKEAVAGERKYTDEEIRNRQIAKIFLIIIAIIMIIFGSMCFGYYLYTQYTASEAEKEMSSIAETTTIAQDSPNIEIVDNPIDFKSLQKKNKEIYAWIKVPKTKVDYPIVQSKVDDDFYLKHSATNKQYSASGAIYTELCNTTTFNDRVTLIYGHNGYGDSMFTTLHKFESKEFFDKNPYFYIYTPDSKLTYQVISAFKYDDRHIMNSFDFKDVGVFNGFIDMIKNPDSNNKNVRKKLDKDVTINDNIVVLSTCISHQTSSRYLVCGVLVKNEKTN